MEANRDDALDCLRLARDAFRKNDVEKARRLAKKSLRLYPTSSCEGKPSSAVIVSADFRVPNVR